MAEPLSSLNRPSVPPTLGIFEALAQPPPENVIATELAARTSPGDIVIDLHGRGGWVARSGIGALRRVYDLESSALTRLLAEVVLRPPDLRHFDAAVATLAAHPRGDGDLRTAVSEPFSTRCPTCSRPVVAEEFIWDGSAELPSRRVLRCPYCREQGRGGDARVLPLDDEDRARARATAEQPRARRMLRGRFPVPELEHPLPDELLGLYTPRTLVALEAIINRLEVDLRAAPIAAALQLALVQALLPASRLSSYPGRVAALRIQHGRMRPLSERQWRERNPWLVFEESCRQVRGFIQRIEASTGSFQPRQGDDLDALVDGTANVVLRTGSAEQADNAPTLWQRPRTAPDPFRRVDRADPRERIRLVLTQPPVRWTTENLSFAYLTTALVLGHQAAATLPLGGIFGPPPRSAWGREASALRRSLLAVRPVLADDASAVLVLDRSGPAGLVAAVLGGVGAGFRLTSAVLTEAADEIDGVVEFSLAESVEDPQLAALVPRPDDEPFALADVERAVSDVAVAVLQARGEPARAERLLGEVLIGLDRLGHLRRLAATSTFAESQAVADADPSARDHEPLASAEMVEAGSAPAAAEPFGPEPAPLEPNASGVDSRSDRAPDEDFAEPPPETFAAVPEWALGPRSPHDHVRLLMEIVMGELRRPDHPRLVELDDGRWWLRDPRDIGQARSPLSDRLEWSVFGLLSTSRGIDEESFLGRIARMYRGHDTPDEELVRQVLASYRDADARDDDLRTADELAARHADHGTIVGMLAEFGHRLGLRVWVSEHEQRRSYREGSVGDLLSDEERRAYLPLVADGDAQVLESLDCLWYVRGKAAFVFEVEWTAMVTDALLVRGPKLPADERTVRFLVLPDERIDLLRYKLSRSALLRRAMDEGNWHVLRWSGVRRLQAAEEASLDLLAPLLGLDPEIERQPEQIALFD